MLGAFLLFAVKEQKVRTLISGKAPLLAFLLVSHCFGEPNCDAQQG